MGRPTLLASGLTAALLTLAGCEALRGILGDRGSSPAVPLASTGTLTGQVLVEQAPSAGGQPAGKEPGATPASGGTLVCRSASHTSQVELSSTGTYSAKVPTGATYTLEATVPDGRGGVTKAITPLPITVPAAKLPPVVEVRDLVTRKTGTIQGRVDLGNPRAGDRSEGADVCLGGGGIVAAKVSETGRFALAHVPEGSWTVVVSKPGYRRQRIRGVMVKPGGAILLDQPIVLSPAPSALAGCRGTALGSDGKPLVGASVSIFPQPRLRLLDAETESEPVTVVTDPQGRYEISDLPPADYSLQIFRAFHHLPPRRGVSLNEGPPVEVGSTRLGSLVTYFGKVTAEVRDERGQPIDGALAQCEPPVTENQFSDAQGVFTLDRMLPGEYTLTVSAGGYRPVIVPLMLDNKRRVTHAPSPQGAAPPSAEGGGFQVDLGVLRLQQEGESDTPAFPLVLQAEAIATAAVAPVPPPTNALPSPVRTNTPRP
ncbi:MAG: carboxypeptidase-like regulatory domain-containing protein [Candidatus Sericytochromatia bacterium]|nr:carboxypeptidase-like regulatory domain-containing protein [Candidatus Sericytochromatia bacterium]